MKSDRHKIRAILRREMKKINNIKEHVNDKHYPFAFSFGQAKFDTLMDIDRELKLGAFYKAGKEELKCDLKSLTLKHATHQELADELHRRFGTSQILI